MVLAEFKPVLLSKSVARTTLPADAELYERVFSALKRVAFDTIPIRLSKRVLPTTLVTFPVFRKVDDQLYIRLPSKPINDDEDLDIDESLVDAVALYVMAGLERANAKTYMGLYYREIEMNNDRLTETILSESSNDCAPRFGIFP